MWVPGEELPASGQSKCKGLEAGMCPAALCPEGAAVVGGEGRGWKQWEIEVGSGQMTLSVGLLSEMQSSERERPDVTGTLAAVLSMAGEGPGRAGRQGKV